MREREARKFGTELDANKQLHRREQLERWKEAKVKVPNSSIQLIPQESVTRRSLGGSNDRKRNLRRGSEKKMREKPMEEENGQTEPTKISEKVWSTLE